MSEQRVPVGRRGLGVGLCLGGMALMLVSGPSRAAAGTGVGVSYVVNSTSDDTLPTATTVPTGHCVDGGTCTLRDAITLTNQSTDGDNAITFQAGLGSISVTTGDLPAIVGQTLTVTGNGATSTIITGGDTNGLFDVTSGTVSIDDLTAEHGFSTTESAGLEIGNPDGDAQPVSVTADDDTFKDNNAAGSDASSEAPQDNSFGGAISDDGATAVTFDHDTFTDNVANNGGAVYLDGATDTSTATLDDDTFTDNQADLEACDTPEPEESCLGAASGGGLLQDQGLASLSGDTFTDNQASFGGGALLEGDQATVTGSTFDDNVAALPNCASVDEESDCIFFGYGGGVFAATDTTTDMTADTFEGNVAAISGNAVEGLDTTNISSSTIADNGSEDAPFGAEAISESGLTLALESSTVADNIGGGVSVGETPLTYFFEASSSLSADITDSTLADNVDDGFNYGSAVSVSTPTLDLGDEVSDAASAHRYSAAAVRPTWLRRSGRADVVAVPTSSAQLVNDTVADNSGSDGEPAIGTDDEDGDTITVANTVLDNEGGNCSSDETDVTSEGHNLDSDGSCQFSGTGDISNVGANLSAQPADNGGATDTLALLPGSPAINAGSAAVCAAAEPNGAAGVDQRGVARPQGSVCDMGAFEDDQPTVSLSESPATLTSADKVTVTVTVTASTTDAGSPEGEVDLTGSNSNVVAVVNRTALGANSTLPSSGSVTFVVGPFAAGTETLTASFVPSNGFLPATGHATLTIAPVAVPVPVTGAISTSTPVSLAGGGALVGLGLLLLGGLPVERRVRLSRR